VTASTGARRYTWSVPGQDGNRLALGQEVTAAKSYEITVIPKLELLELTGCIVTIDAIAHNG